MNKRRKIVGIVKDTLDFILEVSKSSHPHPAAMHPSEQDLLMFSKTGNCHIITFYPYAEDSWRCYNSKGEDIVLEIVEKDLEKLKEGGELLW